MSTPSPPSVGKKIEDSLRDAGQRVSEKISEGIEHITNLDVSTFVIDPTKADFQAITNSDLNFNNLKNCYLVAFTRINMTGDIIQALNGDPEKGELKLEQRLLDIHNKNTDTAITTWNTFLKNVLTVTATIWSLVDPNPQRTEVIKAMTKDLQPPVKIINDSNSTEQK